MTAQRRVIQNTSTPAASATRYAANTPKPACRSRPSSIRIASTPNTAALTTAIATDNVNGIYRSLYATLKDTFARQSKLVSKWFEA